MFPTFIILHLKLCEKFILRLSKSLINEYSDKIAQCCVFVLWVVGM